MNAPACAIASCPSGNLPGKDLPAMEHPLPDLGLDRDSGPAGPVHKCPDIGDQKLVCPGLHVEAGDAGKARIHRRCKRVLCVMAGKVDSTDRVELPGRDPVPVLILQNRFPLKEHVCQGRHAQAGKRQGHMLVPCGQQESDDERPARCDA